MSTRTYNLVDIGLNVDLSGLEERLDEMQEKIDEVESIDENDVERLIDSALEQYDPEDHIDLSQYANSYDVEDLERRVSSMENLNTCEVDLNDLNAVNNERVDLIESRLDDLENFDVNLHSNRVDDLDTRLTEVEQTLESTQQRLTVLEDGSGFATVPMLDDLDTRVTGLESHDAPIGELQDKLRELEELHDGDMAKAHERDVRQNERIEALQRDVHTQAEMILALQGRTTVLEQQVMTLQTRQQSVEDASRDAITVMGLLRQIFTLITR